MQRRLSVRLINFGLLLSVGPFQVAKYLVPATFGQPAISLLSSGWNAVPMQVPTTQ